VASGQFCKPLTGTDVYSGWVEECALRNAENRWVWVAFANIEAGLHFPLKGARFDNGTGVINKPFLEWCLKRNIEPPRSRQYRKNGNYFTERKTLTRHGKTWVISGSTPPPNCWL
jgi:hypothetical protein